MRGFRAIQGEVDALARAHRLPAHNRWSDTELDEILALGAVQ